MKLSEMVVLKNLVFILIIVDIYFFLVHTNQNSLNIIKKQRINEKNLMSQFFGEQYYNRIIDGIDEIKDKKHFILDKDLYYFFQISFTRRAFDMAVLKKDQDNVVNLIPFQVLKID